MSHRTSPALLGFCFDFLTLRFLNSFSRGLDQIEDNETMRQERACRDLLTDSTFINWLVVLLLDLFADHLIMTLLARRLPGLVRNTNHGFNNSLSLSLFI